MPKRQESVDDLQRWFRAQAEKLWPAALGSLSLRRTGCIRERCHACQTGEQHPSYVLYGRSKGQRFAVYVPDALTADIQRSLANGRALQELLYEVGERYAQALKRGRSRTG